MKIIQEIYLLKGEDLVEFLNTEKRKSIPYSYIKEHGYKLIEKYNPAIDYLTAVDEIYFNKGD